jgi:NAD(P)-dependent dehydrogenase (short-subunit alcohol dehydrogenase family)
MIDVNLKSYFLMAKYAIPELRKRGGGVIINNASVQGLQSQKGVPAYAASKGGVLALTRQMAVEYAAENIRVVAICPGTIDTDMVRAAAAREPDGMQAALERWGKRHPLGRIGTGQDVANVVTFLASERAAFITGEFVCVDGGYMALGAWAD